MIKLYNHPEFYNINHSFEGEIWKPIEGYKQYYHISSMGRVKALDRIVYGIGPRFQKKRIMRQPISMSYLQIGVTINGKQKIFKTHRLVAVHFVKNDQNKPYINHINCDKLDNQHVNLEWVTHAENVKHAIENGLIKSGEDCPSSILNSNQVLMIRKLRKSGLKLRELAEMFNIGTSNICHIVQKKTWKHLL